MPSDVMTRQVNQALFRHLPGQAFVWKDKGTVIGRDPYASTDLDVPPAWIKLQMRRLVRPFAESLHGGTGVGPEIETIERTLYALKTPSDLRAERWPNSFRCPGCGFYTVVGPTAPVPQCRKCKRNTVQFTFVEAHNCGHFTELRPARCRNNCGGDMALLGTSSLKVSTWAWKCLKCGYHSSRVYRQCTTCRREHAKIVRATQKANFYPQHITVLNPPHRDDYPILTSDATHKAAIGQSLRIVNSGMEGLRTAAASPAGPTDAARATIAALGITENDPLFQVLMDKAGENAAGTANWEGEIDSLHLTDDQIELFGDECLQLTLAREAEPLSLNDLKAEADGTALAARYTRYDTLLAQYKFADVTLLRALPMAFIVAGYTRVESQAGNGTRFHFFPAAGGKHPMYGQRTTTEGLLFTLDPDAIVDWLVASNVIPDPRPRTDARRWLISAMEPAVGVFTAPTQMISRAVLGLIHSASHRMMKALAVRAGLNIDSLAEYLFPANGAFLIYANTRSEFTLGGLEHTFRYDLADALDELTAETRCIFDPPCRTSYEGACAACLHVAEIACARFNNTLSRNYLFGRLQAPDHDATGPGADDDSNPPDIKVPPATDSTAVVGDLPEVLWIPFWPH
ncbi:hypothetical protein ABZW18_21245 [Streptomyces sp. NPDC004647]|uniref:hypothetical protein n=1 Tax=Streptomyces sp. NPDC004647 TaxID=3154671 RepID=UPI00339F9517